MQNPHTSEEAKAASPSTGVITGYTLDQALIVTAVNRGKNRQPS